MFLAVICIVLLAAARAADALEWQCSATSNCTWSLPRLSITALSTTVELMTRRAVELHHAPGDDRPKLLVVVLLQRWQEESRAFEAEVLDVARAFPAVTFVTVFDAQYSIFGALYAVRGFPSLVLFRDGIYVERVDGLDDQDIPAFLERHTGGCAGRGRARGAMAAQARTPRGPCLRASPP